MVRRGRLEMIKNRLEKTRAVPKREARDDGEIRSWKLG
jgi:hypothetical protein